MRSVLIGLAFTFIAARVEAKDIGMSDEDLRTAKTYGSQPSSAPSTDPSEQKAEQQPADVPKPGEPYRSIVRFSAGPSMFFAKEDYGAGLGIAFDFGTGMAGARLAATWVRTLKQGDREAASITSDGFGQYTAEITLDLRKRGPFHPVFGLGFGMLEVYKQDSYFAGIGTGRIGLEYALALEGADVRFGIGVTGVLLGPAPHALGDLGGYVISNASIAIGF